MHLLSREEIDEVWKRQKYHFHNNSVTLHKKINQGFTLNLFEVKRSWNSVIGEETGQHGIDILIEFVFLIFYMNIITKFNILENDINEI